MRVGSAIIIAVISAGWIALAPEQADAFCRVPDGTIVDGSSPGRILHPEGSPICIRRASPDCVGCADGFVHECRGGAWQPLLDRRCGEAGPRRAQTEIPFRHCRYFDGQGMELRVEPQHVREAQEVGLIAAQRCEIVYCRFYDRFGDPVAYSYDEARRIAEDLRSGALSPRSVECRRAPSPPEADLPGGLAWPNAGSAAFR